MRICTKKYYVVNQCEKKESINIKKVKQRNIEPHSFFKGIRSWFNGVKNCRKNSISQGSINNVVSSVIDPANMRCHTLSVLTFDNRHSAVMIKSSNETYAYFSIYNGKKNAKTDLSYDELLSLVLQDTFNFKCEITSDDLVSISDIDSEALIERAKALSSDFKFHFLKNNCSNFSAKLLISLVGKDVKLKK